MFRRTPLALIATAAAFLCTAPAVAAGSRPIIVHGWIQEAIDAASPGDTIFVPAEPSRVPHRRQGPPHDRRPARRGHRRDRLPARTPRRHRKHHDRSGRGCPSARRRRSGFTLRGSPSRTPTSRGCSSSAYSFPSPAASTSRTPSRVFPRCSKHGLIDWNVVDGAEIAEERASTSASTGHRRQQQLRLGLADRIEVENRWTRACAGTSRPATRRPSSS